MASASAEITWLVSLLNDFGITNFQPVNLYCDNQSAMHIAKNPVFHERTKHIDIDCHFTRDMVLDGLIELSSNTPSVGRHPHQSFSSTTLQGTSFQTRCLLYTT